MSTEPTVAILGATGPVGLSVIRTALDRGLQPVAVSRNGEKLSNLARLYPGTTTVQADLADNRGEVVELVRSADATVLAAGVDPADLGQQVSLVRSVTSARPRRLVYVSSTWSYSPLQHPVVDEQHPRRATGKVRYRAEAEDLVAASGGTILHLPDFFGPHVHTSPLQRVIQIGMQGGRVTWPAGPDVPREHVYIRDVGSVVVDTVREAVGATHLVAPGSGPITFQQMVQLVEKVLGRPVRSRALGGLPIPLLRLVDPWARHLGDAIVEYRKPVEYDGSLLESFIGSLESTPYEVGVSETVSWLSD